MFKCVPVRSYAATIDISKFTSGGAVGITLPKNFVVTGVAVKTTTAGNGSAGTVAIKAGSTALGAATFTVAAKGVVWGSSASYVATADVALTATLGGTTAPTTGVFEVNVLGFLLIDETYTSAGDNKAEVDPYTPPEKS